MIFSTYTIFMLNLIGLLNFDQLDNIYYAKDSVEQ